MADLRIETALAQQLAGIVQQLQVLGAEGAWLLNVEAACVEFIDAAGAGVLDLPGPLTQVLVVRFPAVDEVLSGVEVLASAPGSCRRCCCTNDHACHGGCFWVAPDLCSACASPGEYQQRLAQFSPPPIETPA